LVVHLRVHTRDKPFACDLCPHRCSQSSNLAVHKRRIHGVGVGLGGALMPANYGAMMMNGGMMQSNEQQSNAQNEENSTDEGSEDEESNDFEHDRDESNTQ
jgi:dihydroxyacetone kinase